jgi:hypothetical protein
MMEISKRLKGGWDHPELKVELLDPRDMAEGDQMLDGQGQDGGGHLDDHGLQDGGQNVEYGLELVAMLGKIAGVLGRIAGGLQD